MADRKKVESEASAMRQVLASARTELDKERAARLQEQANLAAGLEHMKVRQQAPPAGLGEGGLSAAGDGAAWCRGRLQLHRLTGLLLGSLFPCVCVPRKGGAETTGGGPRRRVWARWSSAVTTSCACRAGSP